jgi:hypothetical protein
MHPAWHGFLNIGDMSLGAPVLKIVSKIYDPSALVEKRFQGYDLAFKTDEEGRPILLFIGKKDATGRIRGKRYARRLVKDKDGKIVKDHWDDKGPVT